MTGLRCRRHVVCNHERGQAAAGQSDALRYLGDAFRASAEGSDAGVDAAVDGLRAALAKRSNDEAGEGVRSELATGGAHLDVAEVLGEVIAVLGTSERCQKAASAYGPMLPYLLFYDALAAAPGN